MVAEFARLLPRGVLDSELALLVKDTTSQLYATIAEIVSSTSSVLSVNSRVGNVVLDKSDVGLSDVDNIAADDLPVSAATQQALDTKRDKSELIQQEEVAGLPVELTKRVQTVNGNTPDEFGNVTLDLGGGDYIMTPERAAADKDVLTWVVGAGWVPYPVTEHLAISSSPRLLPDPTIAAPGDTVTLVDGNWTATAPIMPTLTSPDGSEWNVTVDDTGALSATKVV